MCQTTGAQMLSLALTLHCDPRTYNYKTTAFKIILRCDDTGVGHACEIDSACWGTGYKVT